MAFRLVANVEGTIQRLALTPGEHSLGSSQECDLQIIHPTVSRKHALVRVDGDGVEVEDLGSRNGIRLGSSKVAQLRLEPDATFLAGSVPLRLEEVPDEDLEAGLILENGAAPQAAAGEDHTTFAGGPAEAWTLQRLPELMRRLAERAGAVAVAQAVGEALFETAPGIEVVIEAPGAGEAGVVFRAAREAPPAPEAEQVTAPCGRYRLVMTFPAQRMAQMYRPLVEAAAHIVSAAQAVSDPTRSNAPAAPETPPLPDPPTIVPQVKKLYADAARVARGDVSILILGESGTGKEILARYIHAGSRRSAAPLSCLNCASLPSDLLEAELFGIEKGVATGVDARPGKFEMAGGGTLFLDEIGDMAIETQAKILRVLQSGEVYRLGGREPHEVDVRIVSATNRDIRSMLAEGSFREDLYHRIATWVVEIPPLRHRRADITNLAAYFLSREAAGHGLHVGGISRAALDALVAFHWPGNVRQLENEMARAVLFLEDGELLDTGRLGDDVRQARTHAGGATLAEVLERVERDEIVRALAAANDTVDEAAARLGISRATLYRRMKALDIPTG